MKNENKLHDTNIVPQTSKVKNALPPKTHTKTINIKECWFIDFHFGWDYLPEIMIYEVIR